MAKDEFEIIPMGKSPVHEAVEWLAMYEFLCKQIASAFGIPLELLTPSNTGLQTDMCQVCYTEFIPIGKVESWKYCPVCGTRR